MNTKKLSVSVGEYSSKGVKEINQDFHDIFIPKGHQLKSKGIAIAIADGISSSDVSQIASKSAVTSFLIDYFSTSELWSVQKSAHRVLASINSWLIAQSQKGAFPYDKNRGYVCTFSAMIMRSHTAHIFHIGDTRIYRLRDKELTQLTQDHRLFVSPEKSYLSRALGIEKELIIDHETHKLQEDDIYLFMSDGIYEHIEPDVLIDTIEKNQNNLQEAAQKIYEIALTNKSDDNLTIQIVRVDTLSDSDFKDIDRTLVDKKIQPILTPGEIFEGYKIVREIHATSRSHVYLAIDEKSTKKVVIKTPSIDLHNDKAYLERFLLEEWIAKRMSNPYLLKAHPQENEREYLFSVSEYVEGKTLEQWMRDKGSVSLDTVRNIATQIAKGLQAMHRQELIHQDLRPQNIIINETDTIKIIDYGSVKISGLSDVNTLMKQEQILGTMLYSAPEYFLGEIGTHKSDIYSLGVIVYEMLSGSHPYGVEVSKAKSRAQQRKLRYKPLHNDHSGIPLWVDAAVKKALAPTPQNRYSELSEFIYDLKHPNESLTKEHQIPFIERNPLMFWKSLSFFLMLVILLLLAK